MDGTRKRRHAADPAKRKWYAEHRATRFRDRMVGHWETRYAPWGARVSVLTIRGHVIRAIGPHGPVSL